MTKIMIKKTSLLSLLFIWSFAFAHDANLSCIRSSESVDSLVEDVARAMPTTEKVIGSIAATALTSGSFQVIRGSGFTIGLPILDQPLIFGISFGMRIPIIFDTPLSDVPAVIVTYESGTITLIGVSSPFFPIPAVDNPGPAVNQILGLNITNVTNAGFTITFSTFVNGTTFFPDVQAAIVQLLQYAFNLNFLALVP